MFSKLADMFAPLVRLVIEQLFTLVVFPALKEKDPTTLKLFLTSVYGPIDVHAQRLAEQTPTKVDDAAVEGLMESIEKAAKAEGITLPNLDDD